MIFTEISLPENWTGENYNILISHQQQKFATQDLFYVGNILYVIGLIVISM